MYILIGNDTKMNFASLGTAILEMLRQFNNVRMDCSNGKLSVFKTLPEAAQKSTQDHSQTGITSFFSPQCASIVESDNTTVHFWRIILVERWALIAMSDEDPNVDIDLFDTRKEAISAMGEAYKENLDLPSNAPIPKDTEGEIKSNSWSKEGAEITFGLGEYARWQIEKVF